MHIPKGPFHPHQELLQGQLLNAGTKFPCLQYETHKE